MSTKIFFFHCVFISIFSKVDCQNQLWNFGIFVGPNISNVYDYSSGGGQYFFPFGGERPHYSLNYTLGLSAEIEFFKSKFIKNKFQLGFERLSSSVGGFNNQDYAVGSFLNITALISWKPDRNNDIFIFGGPSYYLLVHSDLPFIGREWESSIFMIQSGINFQLYKGLSTSIVWNEPISKIRGNISNSSIFAYGKVRSFQFVLGYNFLSK